VRPRDTSGEAGTTSLSPESQSEGRRRGGAPKSKSRLDLTFRIGRSVAPRAVYRVRRLRSIASDVLSPQFRALWA